jgi:hypothetical protein
MARLLVLAGVLCAATATPAAGPTCSPASPQSGAQARYDALRPPEVRLRKLHLVRPDLIPYPLAYEVYC